MLKKKAQGMSMNIIVVAAIALIILVVLIIIFVGRTGKFAKGVDTCQGQCITKGTCTGEYQKVDILGKCVDSEGKPDSTLECCISVTG